MKSGSIRLLLGLIAGFSVLILCVNNSISLSEKTAYFTKFVFFNRFVVDALYVSAVCYLVYAKRSARRLVSYTIGLLGLLSFYVQFSSIDYSGSFFPLVALENARHFNLIGNNFVFLGLFLLIAYFILLIVYVERAEIDISRSAKLGGFALLAIAAIAVKNDYKWINDDTVNERISIFRGGVVGFEHKSPLRKLIDVASAWMWDSQRLAILAENGFQLNDKESEFVFKHKIRWAEESPDYPLIRTTRTHHLDGLKGKPFTNPPNVIVIFAEGLSARTIQPYSQKFPGITPNINNFSEKAIRIDNYYNHTFATYRALAGQHCSIFPHNVTQSGTRYRCLAHILRDSGYETIFAYSQWKSKSYLDEILLKVGFDSLLSLDELRSLPENKGKEYGNNMKDRELFESLVSVLQKKESLETKKPFYIGLYNLETHTGFKPSDEQAKYIWPDHPRDEKSYVLDSIRNLDIAFGEFWDYFKQSSYYKNTIVIFTSDHAHYPDKDYQQLWESTDKYSSTFMDRVPLLIYSPYHEKVDKFRLKNSSTLDFAPTLLHLLGINKYRSMFLGHSILDPKKRMRPVAMGNSNLWYEKGGFIFLLTDEEINPNYRTMQKIIRRTQSMELADRLWTDD